MKRLTFTLLIVCSFNSWSSDLVGNYAGITESGDSCRLEISKQEQNKYNSKLFVKKRKVLDITSQINEAMGQKNLIQAGRHNIECADNGSFCFWPFEGSDKVLQLNNEGGHSLSSVNYFTRKMKKRYGEVASEMFFENNPVANCMQLEISQK